MTASDSPAKHSLALGPSNGAGRVSLREAILRNTEAGPPPIIVRAESVPQDIRSTRRWLTWDWELKGARWTKPPKRWDGRGAGSSTDPDTWGSFEDVVETHRGTGLGIGIVLNGDGLLGFDFDDVRDPASGDIAPWALDLIKDLDSYTEVSPSGTGLKALVRGKLPERIRNKFPRKNGGAVELFSHGRYFTITGQKLEGTPSNVSENQSGIDSVLNTIRSWTERTNGEHRLETHAPGGNSERATALAALRVLDPNMDYESWLRVGMALHSADPGLLQEFDAWSRGSDKYAEGEPDEKWRSFSGSGVGIGTLCQMADQTGALWRLERPQSYQRNGQHPPESAPKIIVVPQFKTFAELENEHPRMRPAVIEGIARQGETVNIIANPKFGKSWLVNGLGLHIQTGRPWLNRFPVAQGDVLLIDNELHQETLSHRLPVVAEGYGIPPHEWKGRLCVEPLRGRLASIVDMGSYFRKVEKDRFRCIIMDAKYRFGATGADENSNADEMRFYNLVDQYADLTGATFFLIHHATKGDQSGKSVTDIGAGGGSQSRAADTHLVLRPHAEHGCASMEAAVRSFPPFEPVVLRWQFPIWTIDDSLDPAAIRKPISKGNEQQQARDEEGVTLIRKSLLKGSKSRRALRRDTGIGSDRLARLLNKYEREFTVTDDGHVAIA